MTPCDEPSTLPYELPDFAAIRPHDLERAILAGIAAQRVEIDAVAADPGQPDVANTLEAIERSGRALHRALTVFYNQVSADATPFLEDLYERLAPQIAAHRDAILMDRGLYERLLALESLDLEPDQVWLLRRRLTDARRAGVTLDDDAQATLRDLGGRLTTLEARFARLLLSGANAAAVLVSDEAEVDGLPDDAREGARAAAQSRGQDGWLLEMQLPTHQHAIASLNDRDLRERLQRASESRGADGSEHDTRAVVLEIVRLRAERAHLLGYPHHAAYVAQDGTARTAEAVEEMLTRLAPAAVANARAEAAELTAALHADHPGAELRASDWAYYAERVRQERYALDDAALRPYLELDRVLRDGVFYAAQRVYGLTFTERTDLVGYHPDVRVWEVFDGDRGLGLFLGDFYTRETKRGGAWMNNLVDQNHLLGQQPVVVNNLNIVKPSSGRPTLLAWDEVITLFHEFGHALHGLLSDVRYPSQSGTEVPRDFVEYPSQVNEMWAWEPEILESYAVHHLTGEPMPRAWVDTMRASRRFGEGFATTEYLAAALLDQAWHRLTPDQVPTSVDEVLDFEQAALKAAGVDLPAVPPRYRTTYFSHIFGSGYSAAYYSYIFSEVLDADTVRWYEENGGLSRANGEVFRRTLLARGGSQDPLASFRDLRGRDADITALLERRGLSVQPEGSN